MSITTRLLPAAAVLCGAIGWASAASQLEGKITIDGSSTVYPVSEAAAAAFKPEFPKVAITVGVSGTGGGFKRFCIGETDVSDASRPITGKEFDVAKGHKVTFIELPVALDGLSIVVSPKNDWATQLTVEDLQKIYLSTAKGAKWSDVNPAWPSQPIKVYSPGTDSGTFDYFKEVVVPKGASFRDDMSTSEDDNVLVTGVSGDQYSIGYFGAAYYYENKDKVKAVPIVNPATKEAVYPAPENVTSGKYSPFGRPLFIYVNAAALDRPEIEEFVNFYLANDNKFAEQVKYVALPEEIRARAKAMIAERKTGSAYVMPDGSKREGLLAEIYRAENLRCTSK